MYESLLGIKYLLSGFDDALSDVNNNKKRVMLLQKLFIIEVRYNLDLINVLKINNINKDNAQLKEVIDLLSIEALEEMIKYVETNSNSMIINSLGKIIFKTSDSLAGKSKDCTFNDESIIVNLYKRLRTLKALNKISRPYTTVKNINYKVRLKNLRTILIELSKVKIENQ